MIEAALEAFWDAFPDDDLVADGAAANVKRRQVSASRRADLPAARCIGDRDRVGQFLVDTTVKARWVIDEVLAATGGFSLGFRTGLQTI